MRNNDWSKTVALLENTYRVVGHIHVGSVQGSVVRVPNRNESATLPRNLLEQSWKNGVCCKHLYDPEIQKAMDHHERVMGYRAWIPDESWMVLFKAVARDDIFPIIGHLCSKFTAEDVAAVASLFSALEWCSPLSASERFLEIAVPVTFERDVNLDHWYKCYRSVLFELYGNSVSKSDLKKSLAASNSVFFVNMKTS